MWQASITSQNKSHMLQNEIRNQILNSNYSKTIKGLNKCFEKGKSESEDERNKFISEMKEFIKIYKDESPFNELQAYTITSELLYLVIDFIIELGELPTNKYSIILLTTILKNKRFDFRMFDSRENGLKIFVDLTFPIFFGSNPELRAPLMNLYLVVMEKQPFEVFNYINECLNIESSNPENLFEYFPIDNDDDPNNYENRLILAKFCKRLVQKEVFDASDFIIKNVLQLIDGVVVKANLREQFAELSIEQFYSDQAELKILKTCLSALIPMFNGNPEIHNNFIEEHVLEQLIYPLIHTEIAGKAAFFISEFLKTNDGSDNLPIIEATFTLTSVTCYIMLYLLLKRSPNLSIPTFTKQSSKEEEEKQEEEPSTEIEKSLTKEKEAAISLFYKCKQIQIFRSNNSLIIDLAFLLNTLIESYQEPLAQRIFFLFKVYHIFEYITNLDVVPVILQPIIGNLFNNMITFFPNAPFELNVIDFMASLLELEQTNLLPIIQFFIIVAGNVSEDNKGILREHLDEYSEDVLDYITEGETEELRNACLELANKLDWEIPG